MGSACTQITQSLFTDACASVDSAERANGCPWKTRRLSQYESSNKTQHGGAAHSVASNGCGGICVWISPLDIKLSKLAIYFELAGCSNPRQPLLDLHRRLFFPSRQQTLHKRELISTCALLKQQRPPFLFPVTHRGHLCCLSPYICFSQQSPLSLLGRGRNSLLLPCGYFRSYFAFRQPHTNSVGLQGC